MATVLAISHMVLARAFELTLRPWPSPDALISEFQRGRLTSWAEGMIRRMPIVETVTTVRVLPVSAKDVDAASLIHEPAAARKKRVRDGMSRCYRRAELYQVFQARGFLICHPQVGPELELLDPHDPDLDHVRIAMEPIGTTGDLPGIFHRRHDVRSGLSADAGGNIVEFSEDSLWLVQLP